MILNRLSCGLLPILTPFPCHILHRKFLHIATEIHFNFHLEIKEKQSTSYTISRFNDTFRKKSSWISLNTATSMLIQGEMLFFCYLEKKKESWVQNFEVQARPNGGEWLPDQRNSWGAFMPWERATEKWCFVNPPSMPSHALHSGPNIRPYQHQGQIIIRHG